MDPKSLRPLRDSCEGPVLLPGDPGYEQGRLVWNGMVDRRPLCIVRPVAAVDVSATLRYAGEQNLAVTLRGGGHNVAGRAVSDDAIMIDLSLMRMVTVTPGCRTVTAQGGCLLRDVDRATTPLGLACPVGVVPDTGLGGLATGGGYGWLARKWGLTCDHIVGAEVVTSSGVIVSATEDTEPGLLRTLRGGGAEFSGVVTRFHLALRSIDAVYVRSFVFSQKDAVAALMAYQLFAEQQPDELHAVVAFKQGDEAMPPCLRNVPLLVITTVWLGKPEIGRKLTDALAKMTKPALSTEDLLPYLALQARGEHGEPPGHRYYTKSCYLAELTSDTAVALVDAAARAPSYRSSIDLEYLMGAISEPLLPSAFPNRYSPYICTASAQWTEAGRDAENTSWAQETIDSLNKWAYGGVYSNYVSMQTCSDPDGSR